MFRILANYALLLFAVFGCLAGNSAVAQFKTELPADALAAFSFGDYRTANKMFDKSTITQVVRDPEVRSVIEKALKQSSGSVGKLLSVRNWTDLRFSQFTVCLTNGQTANDVLVTIDFPNAKLASVAQRDVLTKLQTSGGRVEQDIVTRFRVRFGRREFWCEQKGSSVRLSNNRSLFSSSNDRKSLTEQQKFIASMGESSKRLSRVDFWGYVDPAIFFHAKTAENRNVAEIARAEGVNAIEAIGICGRRDADGSIELSGNIVAKRPFARGMRMLEMRDELSSSIESWGNGVVASGVINLELSKLTENFSTIFDATIGGGEEGIFAAVLDELENDPNGPKINVDKDIVGRLQGPVRFATFPINDVNETIVTIDVGGQNEQHLIDSLSRFYRGDDQATRLRSEFPAWKIEPLSAVGSGRANPYYVAVKSSSFVVTTNSKLLTRPLKLNTGTTRSKVSPSVRLNQKYSFVYCLSIGHLVKQIYNRARKGEVSATMAPLFDTLGITWNRQLGQSLPRLEKFGSTSQSRLIIGFSSVKQGWAITGEISPRR